MSPEMRIQLTGDTPQCVVLSHILVKINDIPYGICMEGPCMEGPCIWSFISESLNKLVTFCCIMLYYVVLCCILLYSAVYYVVLYCILLWYYVVLC